MFGHGFDGDLKVDMESSSIHEGLLHEVVASFFLLIMILFPFPNLLIINRFFNVYKKDSNGRHNILFGSV